MQPAHTIHSRAPRTSRAAFVQCRDAKRNCQNTSMSLSSSDVNASSRLGGRTTEWGEVWEGNTRIGGVLLPNEIGLRLSERRATNIGLLYPKVRNNMGWIFTLTSPQTKILGDVSPASPAGLTPVLSSKCSQHYVPYCSVMCARMDSMMMMSLY